MMSSSGSRHNSTTDSNAAVSKVMNRTKVLLELDTLVYFAKEKKNPVSLAGKPSQLKLHKPLLQPTLQGGDREWVVQRPFASALVDWLQDANVTTYVFSGSKPKSVVLEVLDRFRWNLCYCSTQDGATGARGCGGGAGSGPGGAIMGLSRRKLFSFFNPSSSAEIFVTAEDVAQLIIVDTSVQCWDPAVAESIVLATEPATYGSCCLLYALATIQKWVRRHEIEPLMLTTAQSLKSLRLSLFQGLKFFLPEDLGNYEALLWSVFEHGGTAVNEPEDADFILHLDDEGGSVTEDRERCACIEPTAEQIRRGVLLVDPCYITVCIKMLRLVPAIFFVPYRYLRGSDQSTCAPTPYLSPVLSRKKWCEHPLAAENADAKDQAVLKLLGLMAVLDDAFGTCPCCPAATTGSQQKMTVADTDEEQQRQHQHSDCAMVQLAAVSTGVDAKHVANTLSASYNIRADFVTGPEGRFLVRDVSQKGMLWKEGCPISVDVLVRNGVEPLFVLDHQQHRYRPAVLVESLSSKALEKQWEWAAESFARIQAECNEQIREDVRRQMRLNSCAAAAQTEEDVTGCHCGQEKADKGVNTSAWGRHAITLPDADEVVDAEDEKDGNEQKRTKQKEPNGGVRHPQQPVKTEEDDESRSIQQENGAKEPPTLNVGSSATTAVELIPPPRPEEEEEGEELSRSVTAAPLSTGGGAPTPSHPRSMGGVPAAQPALPPLSTAPAAAAKNGGERKRARCDDSPSSDGGAPPKTDVHPKAPTVVAGKQEKPGSGSPAGFLGGANKRQGNKKARGEKKATSSSGPPASSLPVDIVPIEQKGPRVPVPASTGTGTPAGAGAGAGGGAGGGAAAAGGIASSSASPAVLVLDSTGSGVIPHQFPNLDKPREVFGWYDWTNVIEPEFQLHNLSLPSFRHQAYCAQMVAWASKMKQSFPRTEQAITLVVDKFYPGKFNKK